MKSEGEQPQDGKYWDTFDGKPVCGRISRAHWADARVELIEMTDSKLSAFLAALEDTLNTSQLKYGQFRVRPSREFDWFADSTVWSDVGPGHFPQFFLAHPVVHARLGEVCDLADAHMATKFETVSPLALDGLLGAQLVFGGAYHHFRGSHREAKSLGAAFCQALFGERYEDVQVRHADFAWTKWFSDIAWDRTWVVIDKGLQVVTVICSTDED